MHTDVFKILSSKFPEFKVFRLSGSTEALEFAQTKLTPFGKVQKYVEKLEVCSFQIQTSQAYLQNLYNSLSEFEGLFFIFAGLYGSAGL